MKTLPSFFFLTTITLAAGILPISAADYSNLPQKSIRVAALATLPENDTAGETWKVITKANNHQVITVHLHQKLAVQIHQIIQTGNNNDFFLKATDPSLLKETLCGTLDNASTRANDSYLWIFTPLAIGETKLRVMQKSYFHTSDKYAEFMINVVE